MGNAGKERVTLRTLSEHLDLSPTTISVVLNNSPAARFIPVETRERIIQAAHKLQYRPNYLARSLSKGSSMSIGILAPELSEGYFIQVMNGVEEYLISRKYFYFLACHYWNDELVRNYPKMLVDRAVEGLLLINSPVPEGIEVPIVAISGHHAALGITEIQVDHRKAAALALGHLVKLGHTRIAFMKGQPYTSDTEGRWKNILEVAADMGVTVRPELNIYLRANSWSPELGYEPTKDLLRRTRDFTALFCFNDTSAIGAIRALYEEGLSVPHDVSVIGFDDIMGAPYGIPSLTTVRQPLRRMGELGAEVLLERIHHATTDYGPQIVLNPELIVRESTAAVTSQARTAKARH